MNSIIKSAAYTSIICELIGSSFKTDELDLKYDKKINTFTPYIFEFIAYGGYSNYDTNRMKISKYTLLAYHLFSLILNEDENNIIDNLISKLNFLKTDSTFNNASGFIKLIDEPSNEIICLICSMIGIRFYNNKSKLIKFVKIFIEKFQDNSLNKITGIISAYITSLLCNKINIDDIGILVMELLNELKDTTNFSSLWRKYFEYRFRNNKPIRNENNLVYYIPFKRTHFYVKNYCIDDSYPGLSSMDTIIIAYDCLIDSQNNFEKLIYYCCLHNGNRASTGMLGGLWYGIIYSYKNIPSIYLKHIYKILPLYIDNLIKHLDCNNN